MININSNSISFIALVRNRLYLRERTSENGGFKTLYGIRPSLSKSTQQRCRRHAMNLPYHASHVGKRTLSLACDGTRGIVLSALPAF